MGAVLIALPNVGIREQRALVLGIAASIVLHAMVLLMAPGFQAKQYVPELPTLTAVLRQPEAPVAAPAPPEAVTPKPVTEPPKPVAAKPEARPEPPKPRANVPPAATQAAGAPVLTAPSSSPAPSVAAATGTPSEAKAGPVAPPTTVASAAPSAASASAEPIDPQALQGYKIQLAGFAQKYQRYPPKAIAQRWQGITEVKITIGENGRIRDAVVATSSGHDELDQEAIAMVRKAAPITEIKSALRNREFSINLEVVFQLKPANG
jgi:periplasmic protein TonB